LPYGPPFLGQGATRQERRPAAENNGQEEEDPKIVFTDQTRERHN
jgi:hypothetical protein